MTSTIKPTLFAFWLSSCSWRVRIALALKGVDYEYKAVHLMAGEQHKDEHGKVNPMHQVPTLKVGEHYLTQSLPIIEYINEVYKSPPLLPADAIGKQKVRGLAEIINSGIQPLQNLSVMKYFVDSAAGDVDPLEMPKHFITVGFQGLERALQDTHGKYCYGNDVTMADLCFYPQVFNAMTRYQVDMAVFPTITKIQTNLSSLPAFVDTHPTKQPDYQQ